MINYLPAFLLCWLCSIGLSAQPAAMRLAKVEPTTVVASSANDQLLYFTSTSLLVDDP